MEDELLTTAQFQAAVGITYRVLDYWVRAGVFRAAVESSGTGSRRQFDPADIPRVRALGRIQAVMAQTASAMSTVLLGEIYDAMERGENALDLTGGLRLSWELTE